MPESQPKCKEVVCSASVGGTVQIVKYEVGQKYHYSMSRTYEIPEGWTEQDVNDFQNDKEIEIRGFIEPIAQAELDELFAQKRDVNG
jgi:hypothetical protein